MKRAASKKREAKKRAAEKTELMAAGLILSEATVRRLLANVALLLATHLEVLTEPRRQNDEATGASDALIARARMALRLHSALERQLQLRSLSFEDQRKLATQIEKALQESLS